MAKRGPKTEERTEIYNGSLGGLCDASVYCKITNNTYTFTDIRTLVDFEKYKTKIEGCDEDFTDTGITAVERYRRYLTAIVFDVDSSKTSRESYQFKPVMDLYNVLWQIDSSTVLDSAETLIAPNPAIRRWEVRTNLNLCKHQRGRKVIDLDRIEGLDSKYQEEIENFLYDIATIGNLMPVVATEQIVLHRFSERFDNLLVEIKEYFKKKKVHEYFKDNSNFFKWLDSYKRWESFVDNNYLNGSFVNENYEVVEFDETLSQLSDIIYKRSVCMINKYEEKIRAYDK